VWRNDRFGRGGDHTEFLNAGFPAVRMTVAVENYDWQHQDVRTENGKQYGDTVDKMDFSYLGKVAKLNIAALAALASAPPPPDVTVEWAVSTDTTVKWMPPIEGANSFVIRWRRTDANQWQDARAASPDACDLHAVNVETPNERVVGNCELVLPHFRVDDWVFGVSSVSADGYESPVASAVPGGAFKPWVAPAPPEKK
jgi:hypothetical protein